MATVQDIAAELAKAIEFARTDLPGVDMTSNGYQMLNDLTGLTFSAATNAAGEYSSWDDLLSGLQALNKKYGTE